MLRESVNQEDLIIINIYEPNEESEEYVKHLLKELQKYISGNTVIRDFSLFQFDISLGQRINREKKEQNKAIDIPDLLDIFRFLYSKKLEYIFFSSSQGIFSRTDYMLSTKTVSANSRALKSSSDHRGIKLTLNNKQSSNKNPKM